MNKKEIEFELNNDIPTLIKMQEISLKEIKKTMKPGKFSEFQEDILKVLKVIEKMDIERLDDK